MAASGSINTAQLPVLKSTILYNQPSLPHLLTEYGFEDKAVEKLKKDKEAEKERRKVTRKQKKKTQSFDDGEDEREMEREKQKEEHYLQLIRDMYRLRDYYYNEYSSLLSDKVEKQRREQREKDEEKRRQRERQEQEEQRASHRVKKRLERHTLDKTPAPVDVPKTDLYYIIGLEDKLRREGKIKTPSDYNKFRQQIQNPQNFYSQFKVHMNTESEHQVAWPADHVSTHSQGESLDNVLPLARADNQDLLPQHQLRSLSRISETHESSRPGTRLDNWAVTQQFPAHHKPRRSISGLPPPKPKVDNQSELEKRFPKLEMPKLHCFNMNLAQKPPDPEEVLQESRLRTREKERKKLMRTVGKMYQLAMSNAAVSNRILEEHEDMDILFQGPDLCDVIADHHWMEAYGLRDVQIGTQQSDNMEERHQGQGHDEGRMQEQRPLRGHSSGQEEEEEEGSCEVKGDERMLPEIRSRESSSRGQRSQAGSRTSSRHSKKSLASTEGKVELQALTLDQIEDKCQIKEAKTLSTLWTNYLRAGK